MTLKTHDGNSVDPNDYKLVRAIDIVDVTGDLELPLWSKPVLEYNHENGHARPYVQLTIFGLWIQFGWVFEQIERPGRIVKPPRVGGGCSMIQPTRPWPWFDGEPQPVERAAGSLKRSWW